MRFDERAVAPGDRERGLERRAGRPPRPCGRAAARPGAAWCGCARERPEPSTTRGRRPKPAIVRRTTTLPALRGAGGAELGSPSALISVSALKLSDGRLVTRASSAIVGELCSASVSAAGGVRPIVGAAPPVTPRRRSALLELAGGEARGVLLEVRAAQARAAAVEGQRAQRPDLAGGAVALRRRAAQRVEGRLVADHAPGDLAQALVEHELVGELGRLARAEARVAAAAQVEVADQHARRGRRRRRPARGWSGGPSTP